ncbi:VOC family protein [Streptomyces yaizuensis]|uniref:VOC family protein n=1 Tax=Streptomyces yaizuensis TaxID=2989713 RepID=A0ABQ5P875_9ACTN|nr:VOC family protein [Streptomyces sp. YSPA8]GLF98767.1 VOC family protein [Streptomyces sp. YSPA8]
MADAIQNDGETTVSNPTPSWFDISTPDSARARDFYQKMFGWTVTALDDTYALVGTENAPPAGGIGQAGPESPYVGIVVYFPVADVDVALARAVELGGTVVMKPQSTGDERIAAFKDLDGNTVGVTSP